MIMKPLLVEHVEAVLALNLWNYRMTLSLMVGETCLGQGLEGAARVVAVQSSLRIAAHDNASSYLYDSSHCFLLLY